MTPRPRHLQRSRRGGASAVEFAMVATPFFFMLFAIMELGLVFVTDSILENALLESGRLIRTGQAQNARMTEEQFKADMCSRMSIFSTDCDKRATLDIREITQFRNVTPPDPLADGKTFDKSQLIYDGGNAGSLMLVRVWYEQPLITPFLSKSLTRLEDDKVMIMVATTTFRNEPY